MQSGKRAQEADFERQWLEGIAFPLPDSESLEETGHLQIQLRPELLPELTIGLRPRAASQNTDLRETTFKVWLHPGDSRVLRESANDECYRSKFILERNLCIIFEARELLTDRQLGTKRSRLKFPNFVSLTYAK
ncbi:hypothetical protein CEXT_160481 [Caerostris extrusa]|uniref:Uncharacterized protein n=1 Tax=Caerostris extrusa TaxID=172846 RepID=A0AAV4PIM4_CAEEX|nr:hypothetical protein CEXT_160481 [Caerostris extrusa]